MKICIDLDPVYDKLFDILWVRFTTAEGYTVFPDVPDTLADLKKRGFKMGVVSNTDDTLGNYVPWHIYLLPYKIYV